MFEDIMTTYRTIAEHMSSTWQWRWITINSDASGEKSSLMSQKQLFESLPEINPRFFSNFAVDSMTIQQEDGTIIILKRVR